MTEHQMSRWSLLFEPETEAHFRAYFHARFLAAERFSLLLGIALFVLCAPLDSLILPGHERFTWTVRCALMAPLLAAVLAWTYRTSWPRYADATLMAAIACSGTAMVSILAVGESPGDWLYFGCVLLVLTFAYSAMRARFTYVVAAALFTSVLYVVVCLVKRTPGAITINNAVELLCFNAVGTYAIWSFESAIRDNFRKGLLIESRNEELRASLSEVSEANRLLSLSQAEVVSSARKAQLIFSALTEALPGYVIDDKYEVGRRIGSGGFGTVYQARHLLLGTTVALKIFKPMQGQDASRNMDRFRAEGISAFRVNHPNAVRVLDIGLSAESLPYLVMEYLEGESLEELLKSRGALGWRDALPIVRDLANALVEAHGCGVIHRDLKPSNVMLDRSGGPAQTKLLDFGIAKLTDDDTGRELKNLTATGLFMGTPNYMAPERFLSRPYDGSSDIYSLGVLAFELIAGRRPFEGTGESYLPVAMQHIHDTAPSLAGSRPEVPAPVVALVAAMLEKDPALRPDGHRVADVCSEALADGVTVTA